VDSAVADVGAAGLAKVDVGEPVADVAAAANREDNLLTDIVSGDVASDASARAAATCQLKGSVRGKGSLHEGCYDYGVVGLDAFAAVVVAGYFLARGRLRVAIRCGTVLDVKLEVFIVKLRGGDSCRVYLLGRGLS
jgi:hypothetical protein